MKFNTELFMKNHFCIGVKRSNRYVYGDEAGEEEGDKAIDLLVEAVRRIQH